ncbi:MAG: VWA domain-containing protein [Syntrophotaleaceae bacterium]
MIQFAWPWALLLLPLPYLVYRLLPPALAAEEAALWVPSLEAFAAVRHEGGRRRTGRFCKVLAACCWLLLVLACARPQWLGDPVELPVSGRDLVLAVDISGSMTTEDFELGGNTVDRLTALKAVAAEFIARRVGDRLGLILFGEQAYVQTPLTFDRPTLQQLLDEAVVGLAGQKTAIGDAIGLAVKRLEGEEGRRRVLILLTDGANTAGRVSPLKAVELAAGQGLKIYTIGIGAEAMEVGGLFFSRTVNPSADLDEETLTAIAGQTGGRYFRARDSAELVDIYALLDRLEPVEREQEVYRPITELYFWPLGLASAGAFLLMLARHPLPFFRRRS